MQKEEKIETAPHSLLAYPMWTRYEVTLAFRDRVVGGIPNNRKLIEGWIGANMPAVSEEEKAKLAEATVSQLPTLTEEKAEGMWTTFKNDGNGIYLEGRCVKAMIKEASNILRPWFIQWENEQKKGKSKAEDGEGKKTSSRFTGLKAKAAERVEVEQNIIYIMRDGKKLPKPDGNEEKPIHIMTAQGPRTALKRFDFVNSPAEVKFTLRFLRDGVFDIDVLTRIFEYSSWNGLGADRSQGMGMFDVVSIDLVK